MSEALMDNKEKLDPEKLKETEGRVVEAIKTVFDPEIPVNIYELGLIYEVQSLPLGQVYILMTLTSPNCPAAQTMPEEVKQKVKLLPEVNDVDLEITFDPPWTMEMMSEEAQLELGFL